MRFSSADDKLRIYANYRLSSDSVDELFGIGRLPLDDYEVLDISASYLIDDRFEVYGRIENVTDKAYEEVTGYFSSGSFASAGVRISF